MILGLLILVLGSTWLSGLASRLLGSEMACMGASGLTLLTLLLAGCSYFSVQGPPPEVSLILGLLALGGWIGFGLGYCRTIEQPGTGLTHSGSLK